jgi:hypothetical protein
MNRTTRIERARSVCDSAEWLKLKLQEPFMRVVLQNTVNHVRRTIRGGNIEEIEREAAALRGLVERYREMAYA